MFDRFNEAKDYIVLSCEKDGMTCEYIIKREFAEGVTASHTYHFHSTYEIHIPVSGTMHILAEEQNMLLHPGEVCIIPPNTVHYVFANDNAFKIGFRFLFRQTSNGANQIYSAFQAAFGISTGAIVVKNCQIYDKYLMSARENFMQNHSSFMTAELLFLALWEIACTVNQPVTAICDHAHTDDILRSELIEIFLNEHYNEDISLQDLARFMNLSNRQTERITAKLFGMTFNSLLNKKRLSTARMLLKSTDIPIEQIAALSGFSDITYFYRRFSAAFGITPGKYRKRKEA